jgi:hypothetical protein
LNLIVTFFVTYYRDALIATYPKVKTLMWYFHVVDCCKKNLRSHPAATQKQICEDVYYLHSSISQIEFESRYMEVAGKWRRYFPEFARYFSTQWIFGNFTSGKIYCSEAGIASTNYALESFIIKKSYTLNTRHTLSVLTDIFMEQLVLDVSMDVNELQKYFEMHRLSASCFSGAKIGKN